LALSIETYEIDISMEKSEEMTKKQLNKSAMSYMSNFPLECFQEVNIIDGYFKGEIKDNNKTIKVSGKTYMEKTYGNKFPQNWIWLQSNHFDQKAALTFAYGKIPLLKWKVKGFFSILNFNGLEYRFASYNLARLKINKISPTKAEITLKRGFHKLILVAEMIDPVKLVGPLENGKMNLDVFESINSVVTMTLYKRNKIIFESRGRNVGFELVI
jgi:tocopherol cyclase